MKKNTVFLSFLGLLLGMFLFAPPMQAEAHVRTYPAPEGEPLSTRFKVSVEQSNAPVYLARVCSLTAEQRQPLGPPVERDTTTASFASFDMDGAAKVSITCAEEVKSVKVLPTALGIKPLVSGSTITFTLEKPGQLTIEVNGDWVHSLHLFADPLETDIPNPKDPRVIYFGPGIHHVQSIPVGSGQTVYIAGGAIVYGATGEGNPHAPIFQMKSPNATLRGRGIIDGSLCLLHTRSIVGVTGSNIKVEGVVLRDSSGFTLPVRRSESVKIDNVKIFGWRANSDGMDICNSRQVNVTRSFLRTFDDLIVLKTDKNQGELRDVTVRSCVLWNEFAHALSLGAELREPLANISFSDCDIIRDKGREWLLRVYNCDSAPVKNVLFENIRIEEARRLMSVWIGTAVWSKEGERGRIDGVTFSNIQSTNPTRPVPIADLVGFDAEHAVRNVRFEHISVGGYPLKESDIHQNAFVSGVSMDGTPLKRETPRQ